MGHPLLLNAQGLSFGVWNPLGGRPATQTGVIAATAILVMAVTTVFRRRIGLSYEQWQWLHLSMAIVAIAAGLMHVLAVDGYSRSAAMRDMFLLYAGASGSIVLNYRLIRALGIRRRPWTITDNRDEGASTRTLRVCPLGHDGVGFEPGQFAWLVTGTTPWSSQQHPLSISSSADLPADRGLEFSNKALGDCSGVIFHPSSRGTATSCADHRR